jgi:hypothetical protein
MHTRSMKRLANDKKKGRQEEMNPQVEPQRNAGSANPGRPRGIIFVSILMVLFGIAEISTGFTGSFAGVISAHTTQSYTLASAAIGSFYAAAGLLILTMRRWAAALAVLLLAADVLGRFALVATGLYPFSGLDAVGIVAGTAIAAAFALYIALNRKKFR